MARFGPNGLAGDLMRLSLKDGRRQVYRESSLAVTQASNSGNNCQRRSNVSYN
jgi:hypothetical protein